MSDEIVRQLATFNPAQTALNTMLSLNQERRAAQQARQLQALNVLKLQQEPQEFQTAQALREAQTRLAQAQAEAEPEKAGLAREMNELKIALTRQKLNQTENLPSPMDKEFNKADAKQLVKYSGELNQTADVSRNIVNDVNQLRNIYERIPYYQKGTFLGASPIMTKEARLFETVKNDLIVNLIGKQLKGMGSRVGSDLFKKLIALSKPSRQHTKETLNTILNNIEAPAKRSIEESNFYSNAIQNGARGFTAASNAWNEYLKHHPITDPNTGEVLMQNLNKSDQFSTKEAMNAANENRRIMPYGYNPPSIPSIHGTAIQPTEKMEPINEKIDMELLEKVAKKLGISIEEAKRRLKAKGF